MAKREFISGLSKGRQNLVRQVVLTRVKAGAYTSCIVIAG